jgi:hypothetical protein
LAGKSEEETKFLNVDLEILSRTPLDALVAGFGENVDVLHVGKCGLTYMASLQVCGSGYQRRAEGLIHRFVAIVSALPRSSRKLWDNALSRKFDVGIKAAAKSRVFALPLGAEALEAIVSVDGSLVITVYAPKLLPGGPIPERHQQKRTLRKATRPGLVDTAHRQDLRFAGSSNCFAIARYQIRLMRCLGSETELQSGLTNRCN